MRRSNKVFKLAALLMCIELSLGVRTGVAIGIASSPTPGTPKAASVLRFNQAWWQHADSDEQQGFLYGYLDCLQPVEAPYVPTKDIQEFVSTTLTAQQSRTSSAVPAAIKLALTTMKPQEILKGGEVFAGPHGFLDGGWWGEFEGAWPANVTDEDQGYLEGYLACLAPPVNTQAVRLYQAALNLHYASGRHEHDKIAVVLQRLLKQPCTSPK